eukprot:186728-Pelagomonas_calceolata.AAC.1
MEGNLKWGPCKIVIEVVMLLFGGPKLILGSGVFTVFDLQNMDVPLFWKELAIVTDLKSRWSGYG